MGIPVRLTDVVNEMDVLNGEWRVYLNKQTGEMVTATPENEGLLEDASAAERAAAWQLEQLPKIREALDSEDWIALPDRFEIHEWSIMERFVMSLDDDTPRERLERAIHRSGAFRRFKDAVQELDLREAWFRFRDRAFEEIAVAWLEDNGVPFVRDEGARVERGGA